MFACPILSVEMSCRNMIVLEGVMPQNKRKAEDCSPSISLLDFFLSGSYHKSEKMEYFVTKHEILRAMQTGRRKLSLVWVALLFCKEMFLCMMLSL